MRSTERRHPVFFSRVMQRLAPIIPPLRITVENRRFRSLTAVSAIAILRHLRSFLVLRIGRHRTLVLGFVGLFSCECRLYVSLSNSSIPPKPATSQEPANPNVSCAANVCE